MGPRQSGKTTLVKHFFNDYLFFSLQDPGLRKFARTDPRGFLHQSEEKNGIIIDEFHYAPELLSYIQLIVDDKKRPGHYVLTGSQNFLVNQSIAQSLPGRVDILTLLPLSIAELSDNNLLPEHYTGLIIKDSYPRLYAEHILMLMDFDSASARH
jgi:predicted AAA+ superfamily ATPase